MSKYTKNHFQKDLFKLSKLIDNYNAKGGAKNNSNKKKEKRSFKVVEVDGQSVKPYGDYKISKDQPVGPEKAASKALKKICEKIRRSVNKGGDGGSFEDCDGITIKIQERTRGSEKKIYGPYIATAVKLSNAQSKTRTDELRRLAKKRLVEKGMSASKAEKKVNKEIKKITHKIVTSVLKNNK